ncbi:hypothetical protein SDC9_209775 [bioreactor metagenome]|jgi:hypothetical protein|uniref:Uncharacterized protein n=1 Tax=bioreactor metagenome TaxID=1076179 RepID=A0A645JH65_9ZZZZ
MDLSFWMGATAAGEYMGYSPDWVWERAIPWQETPVRGQFRYKVNPETGKRRYYRPDLDSFYVVRPQDCFR